nr:MAG TPA: hypothetical protein [Caudoviricetes sp.]
MVKNSPFLGVFGSFWGWNYIITVFLHTFLKSF